MNNYLITHKGIFRSENQTSFGISSSKFILMAHSGVKAVQLFTVSLYFQQRTVALIDTKNPF